MENIHRKSGLTHLTLQASLFSEVLEIVPVHMQSVHVAIAHGIFNPSSEPELLSQEQGFKTKLTPSFDTGSMHP